MVLLPFGSINAEIDRPLAVDRVKMVDPEVRLSKPLFYRVPKYFFGLLVDEGKGEGITACLPYNAVDRLNERFVALQTQSRRCRGTVESICLASKLVVRHP